jgi:hypothetical protein
LIARSANLQRSWICLRRRTLMFRKQCARRRRWHRFLDTGPFRRLGRNAAAVGLVARIDLLQHRRFGSFLSRMSHLRASQPAKLSKDEIQKRRSAATTDQDALSSRSPDTRRDNQIEPRKKNGPTSKWVRARPPSLEARDCGGGYHAPQPNDPNQLVQPLALCSQIGVGQKFCSEA